MINEGSNPCNSVTMRMWNGAVLKKSNFEMGLQCSYPANVYAEMLQMFMRKCCAYKWEFTANWMEPPAINYAQISSEK